MALNGSKPLVVLILAYIFVIRNADGLTFSKTARTHAKFPKWNACLHASISFEFKTYNADSLLMYTDDNGKYDYIELLLKSGSVRLRMNIVDGRDKGEVITLGQGLHDNRWHSVELRRNRMESTLYVDDEHASVVAFGSDFNFGELSRNNFVFFGGLPYNYHTKDQNNLAKLSLPSAFYEPRFEGQIRNVVYDNCTCTLTRAEMIEGESVSRQPLEACEKANTCGRCLCVSQDDDAGCQCNGLECDKDVITHYLLPMDSVFNDTLVNPSGLDAKVTGSPLTVPGVEGKAVKIDEKFQRIIVSGPGHRKECFGDLDLCPNGYTIALWIRFDEPGPGKGVYISNGGQNANSHGIAMLYTVGQLEWIFKTKGNGLKWTAKAINVLPRHWYHVMVMWHKDDGIAVYINGNKVARSRSPVSVTTVASNTNNDFVIGQPNDGTGLGDIGTITIDQFQFWSTTMQDSVLREKGPIYKHRLALDKLYNGQLVVPFLEPTISGIVRNVPGRFGKAIELPGKGEHIDLGSFADSCLGNTSLCHYGFTVTFWINFNELGDNAYYMASGIEGFTVFSHQAHLFITVQEGDRQWFTSASGLRSGTWYFLEITWSRTAGLRLFVNRMLTSIKLRSTHNTVKPSYFNRFYIGRANTKMINERYANASFDEIQMFNAERARLLAIDFIQRGRPDMTHFGFDKMVGTKIDHPSIVINTHGSPSLVPGKIFQALRLNGSTQTAEFDHGDGCLGNLDYCLHGVLLCLWIRLEQFQEGMFYLSSGINGISLSRVDQKLRVQVHTTTFLWEVLTPDVTSLEWHYIEISWDPDTGLRLYTNNKLLIEDLNPKENKDTHASTQLVRDKFIFGQNNRGKTGSHYGAATFDEMEFWLGSREYLLAFDYIQRGMPMHYRISMDLIFDQGRRLAHPVLPIMLHGNVSLISGVLGKAVQLNNLALNGQYIDLGDQTDKCLGNLQRCQNGITISFWIKIDNYYNNMYIFSTGLEGIRIYYQTGYIYFRIDRKDKTWRATIPKLSENKWHLLELSWHMDYGIYVYVDRELAAQAQYRSIAPFYQAGTRNFYIGAWNSEDNFGQKFSYANLAVDEFEIWYQRRETLLAFGYILRDYVEYESFSMETVTSGNVIFHPRYHVTLEQGASLAPGKIGNAVLLNQKGQYVDLGDHMDTCMGNLDLCKLGITIALWLKPENIKENSYYLSGPMYSLYFQNGKLRSKFASKGKVWKVETSSFADDIWNHVILSWDRESGLAMYVDNRIVDDDRTPKEIMLGDQPSNDNGLYIGKMHGSTSGGSAHMLADEVQYWYSNIERMAAQGLFTYPIHQVIPISRLARTGTLAVGSRTLSIPNGAKIVNGQHDKAIRLDGITQYIDLGANLTCGGNLDNCHQGFNLRFSTKPDKLIDYTYYLDSFPISIFYKDNRLYATVRTSSKTWTVAAPGFKSGDWQLVDVSWHPEIGLTMHLNDEEVGSHKSDATETEPVYVIDPRTYFGRSLSGQRADRYAATSLENLEVWNVRRDVVLSSGGGTQFVTPKPAPTKPAIVNTSPRQKDSSKTENIIKVSNTLDPEETASYSVSRLDLNCLRLISQNRPWSSCLVP